MRKPSFSLFRQLWTTFHEINREMGLNQQLIPYFISGHPGCDMGQMAELAGETADLNMHLEQVQDFTPTPMTLSSVMFYTGFDPYSEKRLSSPKSREEKEAQQRFFFWYKGEYRNEIRSELLRLGRSDLLEKIEKKGRGSGFSQNHTKAPGSHRVAQPKKPKPRR